MNGLKTNDFAHEHHLITITLMANSRHVLQFVALIDLSMYWIMFIISN